MTDEAATTTPSERSLELSADGVVLRAPDGTPTALRLSTATMLVRDDLPAELTSVRRTLEQVLVMQGQRLLDHRSVLAAPAAARLVELPESAWDLWGTDLATALADLGAAATPVPAPAAPVSPPVAPPAPPTSGAVPVAADAPAGGPSTTAAPAVSLEKAPAQAPPGPAGPVSPEVPLPLYRRRAFRAMAAATALVVAGVVVVFVVVLPASNDAQNAASGTPSPTPSATSSTQSSAAPAAKFTTYHDPQGRFSLSYPASWQKLPPPTGAALVVGAGGNDGFVVRDLGALGKNITSKNIGDVKSITDTIVSGSVVIRAQKQVTINGMPGYYYFYTFTDKDSGQQGANAHYFVFSGARMLSLVFQTLPDDDFAKLANTFDQIAGSLHVTPAKPKPQDATPAPGASPAKSG